MTIRLLCLILILSKLSLQAQDDLSFTCAPFSFFIGAPSTWKLLPDSFPTEEYKLHNQNLFELVTSRGSLPIVRIVKPVPDNRTISPAFQVFVEPANEEQPADFLSSASRSAAAGFRDFRIVEKASDTKLNGMKAAYMESSFITDYSSDRHFATLCQMWAIPHDKMMFIITITGQPDDLKALTKDIGMILSTVRFKSK